MIKRLELSFDEFRELKKYANKKKIMFLSTPDDLNSVDFLNELRVPAFKIGSGELTNIYMLKKIALKDKPIILSTGMANLDEIEEAVNVIYETGNKKLILLHCTSQYPTKFKDVNLRAMSTLKRYFNINVGYSDHTMGILIPQLAVALGANVIEKHFTYDKNAEGPDHICSLGPIELKEMVYQIRLVEEILGNKEKTPIKEELKIRKLVRKTVVANEDIPKGTKITENMLTVKRSDGSMEPKEIYKVINKISQINIKKDQEIKLDFFN